MYELAKLKGRRGDNLMLADLARMARTGELSELCGIPTECTTLGEVAGMLAQPTDIETRETAADRLENHLKTIIEEQGIARYGDYVIRPLPVEERHELRR